MTAQSLPHYNLTQQPLFLPPCYLILLWLSSLLATVYTSIVLHHHNYPGPLPAKQGLTTAANLTDWYNSFLLQQPLLSARFGDSVWNSWCLKLDFI